MKKHMLKIALAVAVVLGVGSIATGSVMLVGRSAPDLGPATAAGSPEVNQQALSQTPDRESAHGGKTVVMSSDQETVATIAGFEPARAGEIRLGHAFVGTVSLEDTTT